MIKPEEFQEITKSVEAGEPIPNDKAKEIIATILEMDASNVIIQNALQLSVDNAREVIPAVAERVLSMSGRTDGKTKKKAAKFAGEITARFEIALQMYLAGAAEEAAKMLNPDAVISDEEYEDEIETADKEATNEETK